MKAARQGDSNSVCSLLFLLSHHEREGVCTTTSTTKISKGRFDCRDLKCVATSAGGYLHLGSVHFWFVKQDRIIVFLCKKKTTDVIGPMTHRHQDLKLTHLEQGHSILDHFLRQLVVPMQGVGETPSKTGCEDILQVSVNLQSNILDKQLTSV